ncbi:hypothetical protein G3A43_07640 [Paraburkholderia aspalathi]|nr:hypothetical protein [Paraburkholderia aspalathi]MBK3780127.1 hypothetical protein [Paraburkholderia aspalathi]
MLLALRDAQWVSRPLMLHENLKLYLERLLGEKANEAENKGFLKLLRQLHKPPPPLVKLDGHAETATADAITAANGRFFLFEFKRTEAEFSDEKDKFITRFLSWVRDLAEDEDKPAELRARAKNLLKLSKKCHYLLYAKEAPAKPASKVGTVWMQHADLITKVYFEKMVKVTGTEAPIAELFSDTGKGVNAGLMAVYTRILAAAHTADDGKGSTKSHPIKAMLFSSKGYFLPTATLEQFLGLARFLDSCIKKATVNYLQAEVDKLFAELELVVKEYASYRKQLSTAAPGSSLKQTDGKKKKAAR